MKQKLQISFLAMVLTMLLFFPGAVKMLHTHHGDAGKNLSCTGFSSVNQTKEPCPVCDFEFVSFISEAETHIDYFPLVFNRVEAFETSQPVLEFTRYFSLRAPPASA